MSARILVVDDDPIQRRQIKAMLVGSGFTATEADGGQAGLDRLMKGGPTDPTPIDLVLLDLQMPGLDGIEVLTRLRGSGRNVPVLVLTSDGSVSRAVGAMRAGATDFLIKPVGPERLEVSIANALAMSDLSTEVGRLSRAGENRLLFSDLIAVAPQTRAAIAMARRVARSDIPVLLEGESGTGKEVFARAIHGSSDRAGAPFVAVNCGAMPAQLVESILFGHEKGAFTGATSRRPGKFQDASDGTLFLDEVGELPPEAQVKLLRAIQTGEIDPVGASQPVTVNIRLISATNRDLKQMVADGTFREDLYYRIGVFPMQLPPLRDRSEDLPGLARMFLKRFAAAETSPITGFSQAALELIARAPWPGNVRQLENTIHRAVVIADGPVIRPEDLQGLTGTSPAGSALSRGAELGPVPTGPFAAGAPSNGAIRHDAIAGPNGCADTENCVASFLREDGHIKRLLEIEQEAIAKALDLYRGRMSETARRLGIGRSTLYRKIDDFQIGRGPE